MKKSITTVVLVALVAAAIAEAPIANATSYGTFAYTLTGMWGRAHNEATADAARQVALNFCGYSDCQILVTFTGCGAIAENGWVRGSGYGDNLAIAEQNALHQVGGWIANSQCN
jgi:hypothetical protein